MGNSHETQIRNIDPRIAFFDALAANWDHHEPSGETMTARLGEHADLLALKAGEELLEVGCGTGKTTAWLAAQVAPGRVTAVDFAPGMIIRARAKGIDADFRCLDVCCGHLGSMCYDVILCFHSFPHLRNQAAAMRTFARALTPTGRLIVMHLSGSERINHFHSGVDGPVREDRLPVGDEWLPLLAQAGLRQVGLVDRQDLFFLEAVRAPQPS